MTQPEAACIGLVSALPEEISPLRRRLSQPHSHRRSEQTFHSGRLAGRDAVLTATGAGRRAAARGLAALLEAFPVQQLLFLGVAGALTPELGAGAVVVAEKVQDAHGEEAPPPETRWSQGAAEASAALPGVVVSAPAVVSRSAHKAALWQELGRPTGAVVDLETVAWARLAGAAGIAYVAARAVSDTASEDLPLFLEACLGPDGGLDRRRLLLASLRRPQSLPSLLRLYRRMHLCGGKLADFASAAIETSGRAPGIGSSPEG